MAKVTFSSKWGGVKVQKKLILPVMEAEKSAEEAVREMKKSQKPPSGEDYREKSLGLIVLSVPAAAGNLPNPKKNF